MQVINLTPHTITLQSQNGERHNYLSKGVARVTQTPGTQFSMLGVPVPCFSPSSFGTVEGLPDPVDGVIYVCSLMVCQALRGTRPDVFQPGTGPQDQAIRDEKNQIIAVTRLNQAG